MLDCTRLIALVCVLCILNFLSHMFKLLYRSRFSARHWPSSGEPSNTANSSLPSLPTSCVPQQKVAVPRSTHLHCTPPPFFEVRGRPTWSLIHRQLVVVSGKLSVSRLSLSFVHPTTSRRRSHFGSRKLVGVGSTVGNFAQCGVCCLEYWWPSFLLEDQLAVLSTLVRSHQNGETSCLSMVCRKRPTQFEPVYGFFTSNRSSQGTEFCQKPKISMGFGERSSYIINALIISKHS